MQLAHISRRSLTCFVTLTSNDCPAPCSSSTAKPSSTLQHDAHYYLLHTFFHTPHAPHLDPYATTKEVMQTLKAFVEFYKISDNIRYQQQVNSYSEQQEKDGNITVTVEVTNQKDGSKKQYTCNHLYVASGSLSGGPKAVKHWNERDEDKSIQYMAIKDYTELFNQHHVQNLVIVGAGSSAVEVALRGLRHGVPNITMVYHKHIGVYYNNIINEAVYGAGNLLPVWLAQWLYMLYSYVLAFLHHEKLPPMNYDSQKLYPFSTAFIHAYNKKQIHLTDKLTDELQDKADVIVQAMGFNNALKQYGLEEEKLTNFNTQYPGQRNVHYVGFIHSGEGRCTVQHTLAIPGRANGTQANFRSLVGLLAASIGTVPISDRLCSFYILRCLDRGIRPPSDYKHVAYFSGLRWFLACMWLFSPWDLVFWYRFGSFVVRLLWSSGQQIASDVYGGKLSTPKA